MIGRWAQELLGYHFTVVHRSNRMMVDVDALSRRVGPLIATHCIVGNILHKGTDNNVLKHMIKIHSSQVIHQSWQNLKNHSLQHQSYLQFLLLHLTQSTRQTNTIKCMFLPYQQAQCYFYLQQITSIVLLGLPVKILKCISLLQQSN